MKFTGKFIILYEVFPYFTRNSQIKNRFSFIKSILFDRNCLIKFKNGINYSIDISDYTAILHLLAVERYSQIFQITKNGVEISFDGINKFFISSNVLTKEDRLLLSLLDFGIKEGAFFIDKNHVMPIKNEKIIKIIQNEQSIIETSEGVKFFLDSIGPDSIVETFVRRIHDQYSNDLMNKVVIDVGASVGDTPLYFASKGARVYAFEMTKTNYDKMMRNLELNPNLSNKITAVHAAVGKDGTIEYYQDSLERINAIGGASFVINKYGKNSAKHMVMGMTIKTILEKFNISSVDLLKLDCKGCEFFLNEEDLRTVKRVKIEYFSYLESHKMDSLIKLLRDLNYEVILFKHLTTDISPLEKIGNILAEKM